MEFLCVSSRKVLEIKPKIWYYHLKKEALTENTLHRIQTLNEIAHERGQSLAEMALAWVLKNDFVTSVIIGSSSIGQLEQNLKALSSPTFTPEELEAINQACCL